MCRAFNCLNIFAKSSTESHCFPVWLLLSKASEDRKKMKCFLFYRYGIFEYLLHSPLTRKYKNQNITLHFTLRDNENFRNYFFFYIAATSRSRCALVFCIKVVLRLELVHSKYTGNRERIRWWIKSPLLSHLSRHVSLWK